MAHQENNAIAEGQAEYYAAYELMDINPANLAWPVPFEGKRDWDQRQERTCRAWAVRRYE